MATGGPPPFFVIGPRCVAQQKGAIVALKEKFEEKRALGAKIKELADQANDESRQWTAEDEVSWTKVNEDYNAITAEVEDLEARQEKADRAAAIADQQKPQDTSHNLGRRDATGSSSSADSEVLEARALQGWLRQANDLEVTEEQRDAADSIGLRINASGINLSLGDQRSQNGRRVWSSGGGSGRTAESRAQSVGTDSAGGYAVSTGFIPELERRMLAFNGPRQVARILRTQTGNTIELPTMDDTGNSGEDLAENAAVSEEAFALGQQTIGAYKQGSGALLVSEELMEDNEINLASEINDILGERLGRRQAAKFTTGTGSGQAEGVVTGAAAGVTAASATAIAADEIKNLIHSLDPAYRGLPSVGFMLHDNVLLAVRKLKDSNGRYLWQDSIQLGTPDRLDGFPVTVNQNMSSAITTGLVTMLFGAFEKFIIRDVRNVRLYRLSELYRANDQTGFMAFIRSDSKVRQPQAIKKLTQA